jgi:very-short-patch-repair endonuclease
MTDIEKLLELNHGLILARDNRGIKSSLSRWVKQGRLARVMRGVYAHPDLRMRDRLLAVVAGMPGAVIADDSALTALFEPGKAPQTIQVCTPRRRRPQPGYVFTRRTIPREYVKNGIMRPVLAAVDVCDRDANWLDRLAREHRVTSAEYQQALAEFPHRTGNPARVRHVARTSTKPWSAAEREYHNLFDARHITGWVANRMIHVGGTSYVPDIAFDAERLILEIDGYEFHSDHRAFQADRHRCAELMRAGWMVLHLTWDMLSDPDWVVATITDVRAGRRGIRRRSRR